MPKFYRPDLTQTASLLLGMRPEQYPFEREIEWIAFQIWMLWPADPGVIVLSKRIAAAGAMRGLINQDKWAQSRANPEKDVALIMANLFDSKSVVETMLGDALDFRFSDNMETILDGELHVSLIVQFFLNAAVTLGKNAGLPASLNKAMFFIDEGGYGEDYRRSVSSLKTDWVAHAISCPFIYTAKEDRKFEWIAPDVRTAIIIASEYIQNRERVASFFGTSAYIQNTLLGFLDDTTIGRFKFLRFPDFVKPVPLEVPAFDDVQLEIIMKYRAPKALPD